MKANHDDYLTEIGTDSQGHHYRTGRTFTTGKEWLAHLDALHAERGCPANGHNNLKHTCQGDR